MRVLNTVVTNDTMSAEPVNNVPVIFARKVIFEYYISIYPPKNDNF